MCSTFTDCKENSSYSPAFPAFAASAIDGETDRYPGVSVNGYRKRRVQRSRWRSLIFPQQGDKKQRLAEFRAAENGVDGTSGRQLAAHHKDLADHDLAALPAGVLGQHRAKRVGGRGASHPAD